MTDSGQVGPLPATSEAMAAPGGHQPANLGDILERVLDRGLVIAGDIRVNLLDIELLTIKLRLIIASLDTAKQVGIDWWERDPWFNGTGDQVQQENRLLRRRLAELGEDVDDGRMIEARSREKDLSDG